MARQKLSFRYAGVDVAGVDFAGLHRLPPVTITFNEILTVLGLLGSILAWLAVRLEKVSRHQTQLAYHQGQQDAKIDCMWAFQMRRAQSELVKVGWGEAHSPVTINAKALAVVAPFLDKFLPFYASLLAKNPKISDGDMLMEFEQQFGDFILEKICIPNGLVSGSCLLGIMQACKLKSNEGK